MEQVADLPPLAVVVFGATLAIIFAVRFLGLSAGQNAGPAKSAAAAQVAAVIVDPAALNRASAALEAHTSATRELTDVGREIAKIHDRMLIELDRTREELRLQRELRRGL
ncbi:hypothetical protein NBH19_08780 [Rhizobium sp. S95]|uniref:Uncharacterized protein n=1 Tax=Ciceribacter sichuanensis TaxID=2949647 RepID=A0AAJ1BZ75_9HYPH|nr:MULTISPECIES: hypothetical protein [unclassified Ciceribacter]MCM2396171.1 hypothetical protein [Ciceribacter sp. S95]MCO5957678.1 hypothetical protein [Ciceribacter sp. S101]